MRAAGSSQQGLVFEVYNGSVDSDTARQAVKAIAQGEAQCCVTGAAFEHLLQLGDPALLETVMRSVVVFSRMKPHQKGQVMDLLGTRGVHQVVDGHQQHLPGLGKTCMYCGDGINDLVALACADMGVAIGGGDAAAAAAFSTRQQSIGGLTLLLRQCRACHAITLAAFKFMVLYELLLGLMLNVAYFMDGSTTSHRQQGVLDFMAISLGLVCSLRPASSRLTSRRPQQWLCTPSNFIILTTLLLIAVSMDGCYMWFLTRQAWFTGGNGSSHKNAIITMCWDIATAQVVAVPVVTFSADTLGFCKPVVLPELLLTLIYCSFSVLIAIVGAATLDVTDFFGFYKFPRWKVVLVGIGFLILWTGADLTQRVLLLRWELHKKQRPRRIVGMQSQAGSAALCT